jgi:hypothetical protein
MFHHQSPHQMGSSRIIPGHPVFLMPTATTISHTKGRIESAINNTESESEGRVDLSNGNIAIRCLGSKIHSIAAMPYDRNPYLSRTRAPSRSIISVRRLDLPSVRLRNNHRIGSRSLCRICRYFRSIGSERPIWQDVRLRPKVDPRSMLPKGGLLILASHCVETKQPAAHGSETAFAGKTYFGRFRRVQKRGAILWETCRMTAGMID